MTTLRVFLLLLSASLTCYAIFGPAIRVRVSYVEKAQPFITFRADAGTEPMAGIVVRDDTVAFTGPEGEITVDEFKRRVHLHLTRPAYIAADVTVIK